MGCAGRAKAAKRGLVLLWMLTTDNGNDKDEFFSP